ncbi:MAG: putative LPS assembly protein LptD [Chitinophagales bacterium]
MNGQSSEFISNNDTSFIQDTIIVDTNSVNELEIDTSVFQQKAIFGGNVPSNKIKVSPDSLDAPISYNAIDSFRVNLSEKVIHLYGSSVVKYKNIELSAERIDFYFESNEVEAFGVYDSLQKKWIGNPVFKEGSNIYIAEHFRYNFKTKKGKSKGMVLKESEGYLHGMEIKSIGEDVIFGKKARYTTCNMEHPHFYIEIDKVKILKDKIIVGKPANLVIEDVRTPLWMPFGLFPMMKNRNSGLIQPQFIFTYSDQLGYGLRDLGVFWAINDKLGLTTKADVFTHGNYSLYTFLDYRKRYGFSGNLDITYLSRIEGERRDPDYGGPSRSLSFRWNLTVDPKKLNNSSFTISTNIQTTGFNKNLIGEGDTYLNNSLSSSISFSKNWPGKPYRLNLSANHNQNTSTGKINLTVPSINFNVNNINPFEGLSKTGNRKWYEDIFFNYSVRSETRISAVDSTFFKQETIDNLRTGIKQTAAVGTQIKLFKYININPSFNYNEFWYPDAVSKSFTDTLIVDGDTTFNRITEDRDYGFKTARDFGFNTSVSWTLFGTWYFKRTKNVEAFRHVMRPNINFNYRPDFSEDRWGFYDNVQTDTAGNEVLYSRFEDGILGGPTSGKSMSLNFSLINDFEMKLRPKRDTTTTQNSRKIKLLNGFGISGSYNFARDSLKLSDISFSSGSTEIYKGIRINFRGVISPYYTDPNTNRTVDKWLVKETGRLFRLKTFTANVTGSFQSKKTTGNGNSAYQSNSLYEPWYQDQYFGNRTDYVNFELPWRMNFDYSLTLNKSFSSGQDTLIITHSSNFNVDFSLTPKWQIQASMRVNWTDLEINTASIRINRDLHCWYLFMEWYPIGRQFVNFGVRVKASQLGFLNKLEKSIPANSNVFSSGF